MKYTLNLATRAYVNRRALYLGYALLGTFLLINLLFNTSRLFALNSDISRNRSKITEIETSILAKSGVEAAGYSEENYQKILESIHSANEILQQDSFRWTNFLDQMEAVVPRQVRILRINPDHKERSVKLSGQARTLKSLKVFLDNIIESGDYSQIFLMQQTSDTKTGIISFAIRLEGAF